jgi:hypothetical protein
VKNPPSRCLPGSEDLQRFQWDDKARERIVQTIPPAAHHLFPLLEGFIRRYLSGYPDKMPTRQKKWARIEKNARELAQLIREARVYPHSHEWIAMMLEDLAYDAFEQAAQYEIISVGNKKREQHRLEREWLYRGLLEFWVSFAGGKLSYSHGEGDPGPAVKFLRAVLREIPNDKPLGEDALIKIIQRERRRLGVMVSARARNG